MAMLLALLAGAAIPAGGFLAAVEKIQPKWLESELRHGIIAFGGGALISAVALVLVPHGQETLSVGWVALWFVLGGVSLMALDSWLSRSQVPASNLIATLSDYIPEVIAMGATLGSGGKGGALLALLIALQNLPEGFNSYREMLQGGKLRRGTILKSFVGLSLLGPLFAAFGFYLLDNRPELVGGLSIFASGGILYIVFGDVAPQAKLQRAWLPPLGAVLGFLLGLVGQMILE